MDIGKVLLIYLCMAIAVSFFFPQTVISNDAPISILGIFDVYYNSTSGEVVMGNSASFRDTNLNNELSTSTNTGGLFQNIVETATTYYQSFIDGMKSVLGVIKILFKFLFSPIIFIADPNLLGGAPVYIKMIFALPLILISLIALVRFIAGRVGG